MKAINLVAEMGDCFDIKLVVVMVGWMAELMASKMVDYWLDLMVDKLVK